MNELNFKNIGASALNYALCPAHYAFIKLFSVAPSFCTAARNIRHLPRKSAPGMLLPSVAAGRGSVCPCSDRPVSLEESHDGHVGTVRTNGKAGTTLPLRAVAFRRRPTGTYIKGSGSGRLTGGQAHRREGRASP